MIFIDRRDAGRAVAEKLKLYQGKKETVMIGLARGGLVVAAEAAKILGLPFDALVLRKIGAPHNPELAIGAVAENGEALLNKRLIRALGVPEKYIEKEAAAQQDLAAERAALYRKNSSITELSGKTVILVDDGIATGSTMFAAIDAVRALNAKKVVVAVPVSAADTLKSLMAAADEVYSVETPYDLSAVGAYYRSFGQTSDEEVIELLNEA